jgi:hypothetical protein
MCLVNAVAFNSGKTDKNGETPVLLNVLAGKAPNRTVISGTIAKRNGYELGKMYIVQITEGKEDPQYGRQFNINKISECSVTEMFSAIKGFGAAEIFTVGQEQDASVEEVITVVDTEIK